MQENILYRYPRISGTRTLPDWKKINQTEERLYQTAVEMGKAFWDLPKETAAAYLDINCAEKYNRKYDPDGTGCRKCGGKGFIQSEKTRSLMSCPYCNKGRKRIK